MRPAPPKPDTPNTGRKMRYERRDIEVFTVKRAREKMGVSVAAGIFIALTIESVLRAAL